MKTASGSEDKKRLATESALGTAKMEERGRRVEDSKNRIPLGVGSCRQWSAKGAGQQMAALTLELKESG